ncbi:glycoside hydrolase N-terminal domain-containing protein [Streptomyces qaidamensis]
MACEISNLSGLSWMPREALTYSVPAADWQSQALPIGNGRLGVMLFADPCEERIQFNEQSLWGGVNHYDNALAG